MTEPRDLQAEAAADPGPEVRLEVIKDLDVAGDADDIAGGRCSYTRGEANLQ